MYADDTALFSPCKYLHSNTRENNGIGENINKTLTKISDWLKINRLSLNAIKSKFMMFKKTIKIVNSPNLNIGRKEGTYLFDKTTMYNTYLK